MRLLVPLALFLALLGAGRAQTIIVHPFVHDGSLLGAVVADRVAEALEPSAELVVGPASAPSLVPPFRYGEGWLTPFAILEDGGIAELHGAMLLRSGTGADAAATGRIVAEDAGLRLQLTAAFADGTTLDVALRAPEDRPELLARRAAALLARRLELPTPAPPEAIDMAGEDDALARALTLLAGGFADEAEALFAAAEAGDPAPRLARLAEALAAVRAGEPADDPALGASLALTVLADDERTIAYMELLAAAGLPAADAWVGAIAASVNDLGRADDAYARAAAAYPYGRAAAAAHARAQERPDAAERFAAVASGDDPAALVAAVLTADLDGAPERAGPALEALGAAAPTWAYPFERLAYLAFDAGDGLAAARALAVATDLEPENDLYWTNLGWAWYLLGFWERSEAASARALELNPAAPIAAYNLGLVRARDGRLPEALPAYEAALAIDPEVDDEAVADVEAALVERPDEPALHYVQGLLYEAEGRRGEAADAFERFLAAGGADEALDADARARVEALRAPPPPLEIAGGVEVRLGGAAAEGAWRPGDPVGLRFEVITPGDELPGLLTTRATLHAAGEAEPLRTAETEIDVPEQAIGYVVDELRLELPADLAAGTYELRAVALGGEDQRAEASTEIEVAGEPSDVRRLVGRGVQLTALASGRPLFDADDLGRLEAVEGILLGELRDSADAAQEVLPVVEAGRFAGLGGRELFLGSDAQDVRDFLAFLVEEEVRDVRLAFVDAYAQWALEGAR